MSFEPIAIVGRGCVLPGAFTPDELWDAVLAGRDLIEPVPADAWPVDPLTLARNGRPFRGGFVRGFDARLDATGFRVPADTVLALDRSFRWLLDAGRQAVREAGRDDLIGERTAVVVGNLSYPTAGMVELAQAVLVDPVLAVERRGTSPSWSQRFCSGRPAHILAEALGASGPAFCLDAACASSLYAIHHACSYLQDGTADVAIAAAVNGCDNIFLHLGFAEINALSPSRMSRPFSRHGDGLLPAEGAAALCLKRLSDAVRAGDTIHAVIRGIGLSNDGRRRGVLAPDSAGQVRAIRQGYAASGIDPACVSLLECHATGTPTGDRTELETLKAVFGAARDLPIGSLKSNLGHLITVAGIAGVLKVTSALAAGIRPPTLHADEPIAEFDGSPFRPLLKAEAWPEDRPRRAAVNNFGFGGNNAHVLIEEYTPERTIHPVEWPRSDARDDDIVICGIGVIFGNDRGVDAFAKDRFGDADAALTRRTDTIALPFVGLKFPPTDLKESLGQQTLFFEAALAATEGISPVAAERAGVIVGMGCDVDAARPGLRWRTQAALERARVPEAVKNDVIAGIGGPQGTGYVIGAMPNLPANRINVQMDWRAFGFTISSEELSGLTALEIGARALCRNEADMVLAGAVDLSHEAVHRAAAAHVLPEAQRTPADAAIAFVLKRRADAEAAGDPVMACLDMAPSGRAAAATVIARTKPAGHAHAASGVVDLARALVEAAAGIEPGSCRDSAAPLEPDSTISVEVASFTGLSQRATLRGVAPRAGLGLRDAKATRKSAAADRKMLVLPAHPAPVAIPALPKAIEICSAATGTEAEHPARGRVIVMRPPPVISVARGRHEIRMPQRSHAATVNGLQLMHPPRALTAVLPIDAVARDRRASPASLAPSAAPLAPHKVARRPTASHAAIGAKPVAKALLNLPAAAPIKPRTADPIEIIAPSGPSFSRRDLEVLACGRISEVFGPLFRRQDSLRRQCRMPEPPMLLADRVLGIAGEPGSMGKGICWTESDIPPGAWYLDRGRMPTGLLIEAGQADLLLISWLGVDFLNRGERVYRLLGCEIRFHEGDAPRPGETVRFQIHIDGHASLGDTRMFFFRYDARIGERFVSSVRHGQAGFFTDAELANAGGVLWNAAEDQPKHDARLDPALCCTTKRAFSSADVKAFAEGHAYACFGAGFERAAAHQRSPGIPAGRMQLIDCVPEFDPTGGPWGRGYLRAEVDVPTDAWFYAGHFHNDPCMPGTLMAEAATQALKFHMAALGFTIDRDGWVFRPVPGEAYKFICRGQVIPDKPHRVSYEVFVEEIVDGDTPMLFGALLARADGFKVFTCRRFGVKLVPDWPLGTADIVAPATSEQRFVSPTGDVPGDHRALLASAWGRPSEAFGSMYARFDGPMRVPRLPGPPYLFMSRVASVDCPPAAATPGGRVIAEYDIPSDAWYFAAGGNATMPFSVLSEVLLQPCGWLAAYMGFALPGNLKFRNLDGDDVTVRETITPQTGTLVIEVTFLKSAVAGAMTLVFFEVVCRSSNGVVASLKTDFGFFPPDALVKQKGLPVRAGDRDKLAALSEVDPASLASDLLGNTECAGMPTGMLAMVDGVTGYWPAGGRARLGRARGRQTIDPNAWYFKAHFFEDPVQAGSLGLEALFNLLKAAVKLKGLHRRVPDPCFETPARGRSFAWKYRGQIVPENAEVVTEIDLVEVIEERDGVLIIAEGSLWVDGLKIYQVAGYPLRIRPARQDAVKDAKPESETVSRIDPVEAPWLADHCPTYCVPVFPMMGVASELIRCAEGDSSGARLVRIESLEISSWIRLDEGPVELAFRRRELPDGRISTQVLRRSVGSTQDSIQQDAIQQGAIEEARIGRAIETRASRFPPAPAAWEDDLAGEVITDPYGAGGLFHHGAFAVVPQIVRSASSSSFVLDAGEAVRRAGGGPVVLLDAILHGIPHHCPRLWFGDAAQDFAAFPYRVEHLTLHQPIPTTGMLRVLSRACAMPTPRTIRSEVQVLLDGRVVMEIALVEALVPTSAFERLAPVDRRPFMRERRYTAGFSMAEVGADRTVLQLERVTISNWLAGTLEAIYDVAGHPKNLTEAIALKEHFAAKHRLHPAQVRLTETTITPGDAAAIARNAVSAGWVDASTFEVRD